MELLLVLIFLVLALLPIIMMVIILFGDGTALHKLLWILIIWFFPCIGIILYFVLGEQTKMLGEK